VKIWVDGDGCPTAVKDIVFRAAERLALAVTVVADRPIRLPPGIEGIVVPRGIDAADDHIVLHVEPGDLVVTQDIPLAAEVVGKGALALEPRGELLTEETVGARLSMRDFREDLRTAGMVTGGPPPYGEKDRRRFAGSLDRLLAKHARR
jgi:uncharacterized protein